MEPLRYIFKNSLAQGTFPEKLKIARLTPICKGGDKQNVVNFSLISVLQCFWKELRITCLTEKNLIHKKQLDFQKEHFNDHAIAQLAYQIHEMFKKNIYTLRVFIHLSKTFDTINHKILLKKLSHYGITNKA